jgi:hypothetical protein
METGAVHQLPVGRHFALDERGIGLRATWHMERGFVNLSLWRDDRCVETFHLTPVEAGRLIGFLARGLADAVPPQAERAPVALAPAPAGPCGHDSVATRLSDRLAYVRRDLAEALDRAAARLRP